METKFKIKKIYISRQILKNQNKKRYHSIDRTFKIPSRTIFRKTESILISLSGDVHVLNRSAKWNGNSIKLSSIYLWTYDLWQWILVFHKGNFEKATYILNRLKSHTVTSIMVMDVGEKNEMSPTSKSVRQHHCHLSFSIFIKLKNF